jgi:hypothetical protein
VRPLGRGTTVAVAVAVLFAKLGSTGDVDLTVTEFAIVPGFVGFTLMTIVTEAQRDLKEPAWRARAQGRAR